MQTNTSDVHALQSEADIYGFKSLPRFDGLTNYSNNKNKSVSTDNTLGII